MKHFVSMKHLTAGELLQLVQLATDIQVQGVSGYREQLFAANLFFEPSTRTKMSFTVAERKLGLEVLDFAAEASSVTKGETVYDTAKTLQSIGASVLVIRHPEEHTAAMLAEKLAIPVINAGDGKGEHPTQCLLDLMTIYQEYGRFEGLKIVIAGDIRHSRVARSNAMALRKLGAQVFAAGNPEWMDETLGIPVLSMDDAVEQCDVMMLLRIQFERHETKGSSAGYLEKYGLTKAREQRMQHHAIIMHPAPVNRGIEIDDSLVEAPRSRIFRQMENGVAARMAVIITLLEGWGIKHGYNLNKREAVNS
ncbi:aspartate carbamoyltransferase catalytic subunit [Terribacillus saccharophilus]|uniref:Aspartate carbamoyltransferase n=1 Tax=Terribacillus saccharophilus TaxID=361277 RepID=A0A268AA74_9BACI|nr:aspartate carbamoyltransferase catalytic subunit [Terribacillus saccharophilus]PAD21022.1 aspartate carbamoyltransferase [Terribacillus saccharophilus]